MHMDTAFTYFRTCRTPRPQVVGGILQTARARNLVWCWLWQSSTLTISTHTHTHTHFSHNETLTLCHSLGIDDCAWRCLRQPGCEIPSERQWIAPTVGNKLTPEPEKTLHNLTTEVAPSNGARRKRDAFETVRHWALTRNIRNSGSCFELAQWDSEVRHDQLTK